MVKKLLLLLPAPLYAYAQSYDPPGPTMLTLGSYLSEKGIDISIRSQSVPIHHSGETFQHYPGTSDLKLYLEKTENILHEHPDITHLGISCWQSSLYIGSIFSALVARQLRPDIPIIIGGYHPSVAPWDFKHSLRHWEDFSKRIWFYNVSFPSKLEELKEVIHLYPEKPLFDYVVKGPGEIALNRIVSQGMASRKKTKEVIGEIPTQGPQFNWELLEGSELSSLYPFKSYKDGDSKLRSRVRTLLSRGCVFRCRFCLEKEVRGNEWLSMSPKQAIKHILDIENRFNPTTIAFSDACFGMQRVWRDKFLQKINETPTNSQFWTDPRLDQISKESFQGYAKKFYALYLALESGSPQQLLLMDKTRNPARFLKHFLDIIYWNNKYQLKLQTTILVAFPGENFRTIIEAAQYWKKVAKIDGMNGIGSVVGAVSSYCHWPGSWTWNNELFFTERYGTTFIDHQWWDVLFDSKDSIAPWWLQTVNPSQHFNWLHGQIARFELASCLMANMNISWRDDAQTNPETRLQLFEDFSNRWKDGNIELRKDWQNDFSQLMLERQEWLNGSIKNIETTPIPINI